MDVAETRINEWIKFYDKTNNAKKILDLSNLNLNTLPQIPIKCEALYCFNNQLTKLQELPNCVLLDCSFNRLTYLHDMPKCSKLFCSYNNLSSLPNLPECTYLSCAGNKYLYTSPYTIKKYHLSLNNTINYNMFVIKIQQTYKKYLRKKYCVEINTMYNKNMSYVVSSYII